MTKYIGRQITLGAGKETVRGTGVAASHWFRLLEQKHIDKHEYTMSEASIGTIVDTSHAEVTKLWGEGGFDAEIDADGIGLMLLGVLGNVDTAVLDADDAYEHTFTLEETAEHQSLTLHVNEPNGEKAFPLACLDSLEFNFERGKILDFSTNIFSQKSESDDSTPDFDTVLRIFRPHDFHFYLADDLAGLDAAEEIKLKSASLEFNKNLEPDDVLGSQDPVNFNNKQFHVSAGISLLHDDDTYKDLVAGGTPKAIRIRLRNTSIPLVEEVIAVAASGTATIVDYTGLSGKTLTIGAVTLTEGVDWTAATDNATTAESLKAAIHALPLVNATRSGAVITITAATPGTGGNALALSTNGGSDLTVSGSGFLTGGVNAVTPIYPTLTFDFSKVYFTEYSEDNGRDDLKKQEITLSPVYDTSEAMVGEIVLINNTTSY
jgi:hypothetical protein